jgi:hypothetical protein
MFSTKCEVVGRPSVVSDDLVQSVDQKICERRRFTISELSCEFPENSRALLYEIIAVRLGCYKFFARWVPKILTGAHKTQRMASALIFFRASRPVFISLDFASVIFIAEQGRQACVQPPAWGTRFLYLCPPVTGWPSYALTHRHFFFFVAFYCSKGYGGGI